ncbi:hypothetical protein HWB76_gp054 [Streptomyces phage Blueeyedbeauty]|uniref:Uncharacterized protein n=1 Tax=Streptomyces phage Blueeyedbeauty TaxID=2250336 RepID=A0A345L244_9CAUD|nr:hypothetical protein HWB76_gp054 [Streptomyces phage Blueeyedbeauty]AXH49346.1 hypothetical protein SEA_BLUEEYEDBEAUTY_239 [Streptomyces phage Blueeyedbeauty]
MPGANWNDLTPQEKADWFDNSIRKWENLSAEQKQKAADEIRRARSDSRKGQKRHKKKHWWNH